VVMTNYLQEQEHILVANRAVKVKCTLQWRRTRVYNFNTGYLTIVSYCRSAHHIPDSLSFPPSDAQLRFNDTRCIVLGRRHTLLNDLCSSKHASARL
jgi:hypothetical protein